MDLKLFSLLKKASDKIDSRSSRFRVLIDGIYEDSPSDAFIYNDKNQICVNSNQYSEYPVEDICVKPLLALENMDIKDIIDYLEALAVQLKYDSDTKKLEIAKRMESLKNKINDDETLCNTRMYFNPEVLLFKKVDLNDTYIIGSKANLKADTSESIYIDVVFDELTPYFSSEIKLNGVDYSRLSKDKQSIAKKVFDDFKQKFAKYQQEFDEIRDDYEK